VLSENLSGFEKAPGAKAVDSAIFQMTDCFGSTHLSV